MSDIHDRYPSNSINRPPQQSDQISPYPIVDPRQIGSNKSRIGKKIRNFFRIDYDHFMDDIFLPFMWNTFKEGVESNMWRNKYYRGNYGYGRPYDNPSYYDYNKPYRGSAYYGYGSYPYDEESSYERYNQKFNKQNEPERVDYQDIIIIDTNRPDNLGRWPIQIAYDIVKTLRGICERDGFVTIQQLLYYTGHKIDPYNYPNDNYGWTRPEDIDFKRVPKGYLIIVPPAQPILRKPNN